MQIFNRAPTFFFGFSLKMYSFLPFLMKVLKTIENMKKKKSSRKSLWHVRGTLGHPGKGLKVGSDTVATHSICPVGSYRVIHYFWFWFLHHHRVKVSWKIYVFGSSKGIFQSKMICNTSNCRFLIELQLISLGFSLRHFNFFWHFQLKTSFFCSKTPKKSWK